MLELNGKYGTAKVFTNNIEESTISQIIEVLNSVFTKESTIRIMPDTHVGKGAVIGTTMTIKDKIVPNLVGVDVGCGMSVAKINVDKDNINFEELDKTIRTHIPHGFSVRKKEHPFVKNIKFKDIILQINFDRAKKSIGTLGGGNHFIELNCSSNGSIYLVIHSGSRSLGKEVALHYQKLAYDELFFKNESIRSNTINKLMQSGKTKDIQEEIEKLDLPYVKKELAYLQGQSFDDYLNDMNIAQKFASLNRKAMIEEITKNMNWKIEDEWESIHNFIDTENMILRKGATSAKQNEKLLIPINMRDGSIIAIGKGNEDWNFSAPHGAGRLMSRSAAKNIVNLRDFKDSMKDVWTTSVTKNTLDESPFVYKPMQEIIDNIHETVDIVDIIKPIYNFKSS
ncbi:MAG: RtcB family protein [Defluviitaleaceae bacterium]|nr:RtcB family protein [Defluviitaleaceae bacterium]